MGNPSEGSGGSAGSVGRAGPEAGGEVGEVGEVAARPALVAVDDDPQVLATVARDLRRGYGKRFRVIRTGDGTEALDALKELSLACAPVALVLSDQRMPGLTGVELLTKAKELHPDARSVLLTAYADTDAAISAINDVGLDHYILKPWDPPEERLFPILDELLDDWEAGFHPPFVGIHLVGSRWSREAHRLREFLSRNLIPFRWIDLERDAAEAVRLQDAAGTHELPLVVMPDASHHVEPSNAELARAVGLRSTSEVDAFDLMVIGAGPAGLAAAVYGASEGLSTLVVERHGPGGQAGSSSRIENYLGFPNGLAGADLARRALDQAKRLGAEILTPVTAAKITREDPYRLVQLDGERTLIAGSVILATGATYRSLDVPGVDALQGAGVFYGASLQEARAYEGEDVVVVGGANSAGQAALHFARYAATVTILVRGASLSARMSSYLVDQVERTPNIVVRPGTQVSAVHGNDRLRTIDVLDSDGDPLTLDATGLFIFIGAEPCTGWLEGMVARDPYGFVLTGGDLTRGPTWKESREPFLLETSMPGVFAVGDARAQSLKRVASAVGEGSMAVHFVHQYLGL